MPVRLSLRGAEWPLLCTVTVLTGAKRGTFMSRHRPVGSPPALFDTGPCNLHVSNVLRDSASLMWGTAMLGAPSLESRPHPSVMAVGVRAWLGARGLRTGSSAWPQRGEGQETRERGDLRRWGTAAVAGSTSSLLPGRGSLGPGLDLGTRTWPSGASPRPQPPAAAHGGC